MPTSSVSPSVSPFVSPSISTSVAADYFSINRLVQEASQQTYPTATLYIVATPIGNIADITVRALHLLSIVDAIACEDTRHTAQLLARYGLSKNLLAAHEHNERAVAAQLIAKLQAGERIALVSDAGTPAVSDPGARIVDAVRNAGCRVMPLPGPCAAIGALSCSGLLDEQFYFVGFLPNKAKQRHTTLEKLRTLNATLVFYEAPHRIRDTIQALMDVFEPTRRIVLARELTKLFEETHRCTLDTALNWLNHHAQREKGEFVVLLEGASSASDESQARAEHILSILLTECSVKQAAHLTAQITGEKKNRLYELALKLSTQNR